MAFGHFGYDGETKAATTLTSAQHAIEPLEHALTVLGIDAGAVVFHAQFHRLFDQADAHRDMAGYGGVADGIVDEVVQQFDETAASPMTICCSVVPSNPKSIRFSKAIGTQLAVHSCAIWLILT